MTRATGLAAGLIVLGAVTAAPGIVLLGAFALATAWLSGLWSRRGLDRVLYGRRLARDRAVFGDSVELAVSVENRKLLPLPWVQADDFASDTITMREGPLLPSDRPGYRILRNIWTLGPFERVVRRAHVQAAHRGLYRFESVSLTVADLFGRGVATRRFEQPAALLVRPRTVVVRTAGGSVVPFGTRVARHGLLEDPALFAGVRPFQFGDPRPRLHQRATARAGRPLSKRFEPSTVREVCLAVDVQTQDGPRWLLAFDEDLVEAIIMAAASLARRLLADGASVGLAVNGWTYSLARFGYVPPRAGHDQLPRIMDLLGRTSSVPSISFERLIGEIPSRVSSGALVMTISSRDPAAVVPALRRLRGGGFEVRHVAVGSAAQAHARTVRRIGIPAYTAGLEPDWRSSDALTLAS